MSRSFLNSGTLIVKRKRRFFAAVYVGFKISHLRKKLFEYWTSVAIGLQLSDNWPSCMLLLRYYYEHPRFRSRPYTVLAILLLLSFLLLLAFLLLWSDMPFMSSLLLHVAGVTAMHASLLCMHPCCSWCPFNSWSSHCCWLPCYCGVPGVVGVPANLLLTNACVVNLG